MPHPELRGWGVTTSPGLSDTDKLSTVRSQNGKKVRKKRFKNITDADISLPVNIDDYFSVKEVEGGGLAGISGLAMNSKRGRQ